MDGTTQLLESRSALSGPPAASSRGPQGAAGRRSRAGARCCTTPTARGTSTGSRACGTSMSAMAAANWPMRRRRRCASIAFASAYVGATNEPAIRLAEKIVGHAYPNSSAVYFTTAGAESNEFAFKIRPLLLEDQGQARQDQDHLAHPRLSRRHDGGDERHRHGRLSQDVRPAGAGLRPGGAALCLSLAGQRGARASVPPRRSRRRSSPKGRTPSPRSSPSR